MNDWWISLWGSQLTNWLSMGCVYQRYLKYIQEGKNFIIPSPLLFCLFFCRPSSWLFPSNHPLLSKVFLNFDTRRSSSTPYESPEPELHQLASFFPHDIKWTAICYLPVHSRHSCILKTFSQSSQRSFSPRCHHTMRKLLNVYTQA